MSCPYTSSQNGKAERIIRSINNVVRSLLFQASMPPSYWVEALSTAIVLLNILPTKTLQFSTPHLALFGKPPAYDHLRVFSCKCYPNMSATAPHKLAPRSVLCVFLGYSAHHKGYRCLDLSSNRVIVSRHVIFDETAFPFAERHGPSAPADLQFLDDDTTDPVLPPIGPMHKFLSAGTPPSTADVSSALPVPLRLCLGRPCLLMMLMIHRRPRSTFHQRCGRRGHLPRHARPRRCPARLERPPRSTSSMPCVQEQDPRPGSHLSDRIGPSRTTTRVDPDRWLLLYQPPRHRLLRMLLHRPPRYLRAPLLSLQ